MVKASQQHNKKEDTEFEDTKVVWERPKDDNTAELQLEPCTL